MAIIFHIAKREAWHQAQTDKIYRPEMFPLEGFIHCSTPEQIIQVANLRFRGQTGLVLLSIDPERVKAEIRYENLDGGQQLFPHIYGPLSIEAVVKISEFTPGADGYFTLPMN